MKNTGMYTATTNQHTWVYGCYAYYLENQIEPGNPEDGVWEAAHWPVPKHKGGTKTILLLKEHHAVHGVLQSEEWQHPCIYGWEADYLDGWLYERCKYWHSVKSTKHWSGTKVKVTTLAGAASTYPSLREAAYAVKVPEDWARSILDTGCMTLRGERLHTVHA
jgi:hypothetical protein